AYTPSPTLSYGLASLLSGQFASEMARTQENWPRFLENNPWITKILRQRGYATAAFLSHWYFSEGSGLDDGFAIWQPRVAEKGRTKTVASSELVFERARNFLQAAPTDRPFFLWAHTIDPREEYLEHMGIPRFGRDVVAQYDHELRYVDEMLAPLFKTLRERTDWNKTIVVLTSEQGHDFGESYRDEGLMPLSQVQQKVPLFIRIPGVRPRPINHPVSLTRIFPTLSEVSNANRKAIPVNEARLSLLRLLDEDNERKTPILSELLTNRTDRFSLSFIEDNMKLHYDGNERRWRLFDLKADPSERDDQYAVRPKLAHKLRKSLARYRSNMNLVAPK
ncbi:MAG: sulfatase-like hydrolase/transferase, partial [Bradymonadia bacterium]